MCSPLNWPGNPAGSCAKMTLAIPGVIAGQSFLTEHRANPRAGQLQVVADISVAAYEYGSRLEESVDVALPIAVRSYDDALKIVEMILRDYVAPALPGAQTAA